MKDFEFENCSQSSLMNKVGSKRVQPDESRLKVYHFILDARVGGPHIYVRTLSSALEPLFQAELATAGNGPMTDFALTNLRHFSKWLYPLEVIVNMLRLLWRFRSGTSRKNILFDVHGTANLAPLFVAAILKIPLVWHIHETVKSFGILAEIGKRVVERTSYRIISVAKKSIEVFGLVGATVIPGGVDTDFWALSADLHSRRNMTGPLRLLSVGNLNPLKGFDVLLKAVEKLDQPWELAIVGSELSTFSGFAADLYTLADQLKGRGQIVFLGWKSSEEVKALLAETDIFILPSRSEACPLVLLEAMAMECTCVVSDVGDVRHIVASGEFGILVESDSPSQLLSGIVEAAALGDTGRAALGARARSRIEANYAIEIMASRHMKIYEVLFEKTEASN